MSRKPKNPTCAICHRRGGSEEVHVVRIEIIIHDTQPIAVGHVYRKAWAHEKCVEAMRQQEGEA